MSTKARYAVTAMLDLALSSDNNAPVPLSEIAQRQSISLSYLEQLFALLRRAKLVNSVRGANGGYYLNLPAKDIAVVKIIKSVNEPMHATGCHGSEHGCLGASRCITHNLWQDLTTQIHSFLASVSLQDLVEEQQQKATAKKIVDSSSDRETALKKMPSTAAPVTTNNYYAGG